jgi:TolA-binding protein
MMRRCLLLVLLAGVLAGCKSGSFVGRRMDNFTAYYNTFYNARKAFDAAIRAAEKQEQPVNRNTYLPLFTSPERFSNSRDFENVIKKCADVLREHPDSKWVDDALLLIGKAYFYQQNFVGAEQKFREVIGLEASKLKHEARFWLARTLIASNAFEPAAAHLTESLARDDMPARWASLLHLAQGELHVRQASWETAAAELEQGLRRVPDKALGGRAQFLLGQVYETMQQYDEAVVAYDRVGRYNPLYHLSYAAQVSALRVQGLHRDNDRALARLRRMERDDKNFENQSEMTYLRGRILQAQGRRDEAFRVYDDLLYEENPTPGVNVGAVRGRVHYALAELYRDQYKDYLLASVHFDTAATSLLATTLATRPGGAGRNAELRPQEYTPEAIIDAARQKEVYGNYARTYREVARMDSLLALGSLDEEAFQARILDLRRQRAREMEERRRLAEERRIAEGFQNTARSGGGEGENTFGSNPGNAAFDPGSLPAGKQLPAPNTAANTSPELGFLFYKDPIRVQQGQASFVNRWGRRPLVPNWRRQDAITGVGTVAQNNPVLEALPGKGAQEGEVALPVIDYSAVPRDSLAQARMRSARAAVRYQVANVLFMAMGRPDSAAAWYRMIIEEDGQESVASRAYYALAEVQQALGDSLAARQLFEQTLQNYPASDFANRIRERLGQAVDDQAVVTSDTLVLAENLYTDLYSRWQAGGYPEALDGMVRLALAYPREEVSPRALLAAGTIYTEWAVRDTLDLLAPLPLVVPDSLLRNGGLAEDPVPTAPPQSSAETSEDRPAETAVPDAEAADNGEAADLEVVSSDESLPEPAPAEADSSEGALPDTLQATLPDTLQTALRDSLQAVLPATSTAASDTVKPPSVALRTLYRHIVDRYGRTPYAEPARFALGMLDEYARARTAAATLPDSADTTGTSLDTTGALPDTTARSPAMPTAEADTARVGIEEAVPDLETALPIPAASDSLASPGADDEDREVDQPVNRSRMQRMRETPVPTRESPPAQPPAVPADTISVDVPADTVSAPPDTTGAPFSPQARKAQSASEDAVSLGASSAGPPSADTGSWTLILGSVMEQAGAERMARSFGNLGYPVRIVTEKDGERTRYRVALGAFASDREARQVKAQLGTRIPSDAWVFAVSPANPR